ncbi:MAG TPA: 4Fe-4S binding protein [Myxococcales bacterium]|jgi:MauM/NapG family ferredoxin protein
MRTFIWLRRVWQAVFLGVFLFFVFATTASAIGGYDVEWFLELDPLVAVSTTLATRSFSHQLWWAVPLIVVTLVFGRFFCGWMCPMGVLHHALGFLGRSKKIQERAKANAFRPGWQKVKYFILLGMLGAAAMGSLQIGWLDPIASTWRGLSTAVIPAASNTAYGLYQGERHFQGGVLITVVFLGALALNLIFPRLYCRVLCPLGALLGLLSKFSLFRVTKKLTVCTECNICGADCQGAADPQGTVRVSECMVCFNCIEGKACPKGALSFGFLPAPEASTTEVDLGRRRWIGAALAGVAAGPLMRASAGVDPRPEPKCIRPPGAVAERDFVARCLKCGACMKACPTGGLQPAINEGGFEGFWTPVLVPRIGSCELDCALCSNVCPTGALEPLTLLQRRGKLPEVEPVKIGSAAFDKGRCLPWAYDTECIVCEEVCPTAQKAIYFKLETVTVRDGSQKVLKRPYVDLALCVGCGTCESRCPVFDHAGVRVSSVGETRSATNRIVLGGKV